MDILESLVLAYVPTSLMPRDSKDFVGFIARHFPVVDALCRQAARFRSDDEIIAFLRPFETDQKSLTRLIARMREVGVLIDLAGDWCPPPFLIDFIKQLAERHVLASPKVIQGWVATLDRHVDGLIRHTGTASLELGASDEEEIRATLLEIADVFQTIMRTVQDNCERIASEVGEYRRTEDASRLRSRLARLIDLHDEYLEPVIRIIDVGGDFFAVTDKVANCCTCLAVRVDGRDSRLADDARAMRQELIWLRRVVVRRAEEARRELAPLCEAAVRESLIAKGVTRALDAISRADWASLALETALPIVVDQDVTTFSDVAVERYLCRVLNTAGRVPPRIPVQVPDALSMPVTAAELAEKLAITESIDDLLHWILDTCEDVSLGEAVQVFNSILDIRPDRTAHTNLRHNYSRGTLVVNAAKWTWKGTNDGHPDRASGNGYPSREARKRVPSASDG